MLSAKTSLFLNENTMHTLSMYYKVVKFDLPVSSLNLVDSGFLVLWTCDRNYEF